MPFFVNSLAEVEPSANRREHFAEAEPSASREGLSKRLGEISQRQGEGDQWLGEGGRRLGEGSASPPLNIWQRSFYDFPIASGWVDNFLRKQ